MRTSDRYIGRQVLSGTVFAVILLSMLLVLGNVFKEIRPLLVEVGAPIWVLGDFVISVLPVSLIFTIPWALLASVLLVFGRLSSGNELTALRCAGLSLFRISMPVVVIGILFSALCLWLNLEVAPLAKKRVTDIVTRTIIKDPRSLLKAGADQSRMRNLKIDSSGSDGDTFKNLHIFMMEGNRDGNAGAYIHADRAKTVVDREKKQIRLKLTNAYSEGTSEEGESFTMLSEELEWMVIDYSDERARKKKASAMTNAEIDQYLIEADWLPPSIQFRFRAEQTRRYASSFACLAFALIGVPLGVKARRKDNSSGLVISLGIGAAYFVISSVLGEAGGGQWTLWMPNVALILIAIILFRKARFR